MTTRRLPREGLFMMRGLQGFGAWEPDPEAPATSTLAELAALANVLAAAPRLLADLQETLAACNVDRRIIYRFGSMLDGLARDAAEANQVAKQFKDYYAFQISQEADTRAKVKPMTPRRAA